MEQNDIDNLNDKTGRKFRIIKDDDKFFASYNKVTKMCREGFSFPIHPFEIVRLSEVLNITPAQFCEENTNIIFEHEENVPCFIMNISSGCKFAKEYECCLGKDKAFQNNNEQTTFIKKNSFQSQLNYKDSNKKCFLIFQIIQIILIIYLNYHVV